MKISLRVQHLTKVVKENNHEKIILNNFNFELKENNIYTFIGHSGSGKTTLVRIISSLDENFNGAIKFRVNGKPFPYDGKKKNLRVVRKNIKIIFQNPNLQFFNSTIIDEIKFTLKLAKIDNDKISSIADNFFRDLDFINVDKNMSPYNLSLGQKRIFLIKLILITNPKILIIDEPTVSLSPKNKENFISMISKIIKETDIIIILVTHDHEVLKISNKTLLFFKGEQIYFGDTNKIIDDNEFLKRYRIK